MIDQLRSLGIEKGKPFSPDPKTKELLESGAREANAWLDARLERLLSPPYFEATHWALPASSEVIEEVVDGVPPTLRNRTAIPLMDAASPLPSPPSASSIWRPDSST